MSQPLFTARDLCVQRDERILGPWSLSLVPGDRILLTGANGTGKSSLVAVVCGWLEPASGLVEVPPGLQVGVAPEPFLAPTGLYTSEFLALVAATLRVPLPHELIDRFDLEECLGQRLTTLSRGQLKRVVIASAFIGTPPLIVLDEPLEGLDAACRARVLHAVNDYVRDGGCALIATHRPHAWGDGECLDLGGPA